MQSLSIGGRNVESGVGKWKFSISLQPARRASERLVWFCFLFRRYSFRRVGRIIPIVDIYARSNCVCLFRNDDALSHQWECHQCRKTLSWSLRTGESASPPTAWLREMWSSSRTEAGECGTTSFLTKGTRSRWTLIRFCMLSTTKRLMQLLSDTSPVILAQNHNTKQAKGLRKIASRQRLILTGTPISNNLQEMWALFDFCCEGRLLGRIKTFKKSFEDPITK